MILLILLAATLVPPDPSTGQVNGKRAMMVWPITGSVAVGERLKPLGSLPPEQCQAHIAPVDDPERDTVYPCGKWIVPPKGRYRMWAEGPNLSSVGYTVFDWEVEPFTGRGVGLMMPLTPAGRVALSGDVPAGESFRVLQIRGPQNGILQTQFDRRVRADQARRGVLMGVGTVLAGLFDRKTNDAIALARPATVTQGKTTTVAPVPPPTGSDVLVLLDRPRPAKAGEDEVALTLAGRKPDVFMNTATRVYAVWYGVAGKTAKLGVQSQTLRWAGGDLALTRKVVTMRGRLEKLPSISVLVTGTDAIVEVRRQAEVLRSVPAKRDAPVQIDALPAEPLEVIAIVDPWEFRKPADEMVIFDLQPIVISGTVYYGRDPAAGAEVAFDADRDWLRVRTDDTGRYEATFWRPGSAYVAQIKIRDGDAPPFTEGFLKIERSETLDFHVPRTNFTVHVIDADTREAIAGASVLAGSKWGEGSDSVQTAITNAEGMVHLPALPEGELVIRARANGYFDSQPVKRKVEGSEAEGFDEIALQPVGDTAIVRMRPDCEVWAVRETSGYERPLWNGTSGESGIAIPNSVRDATFLVRCPGAAAAVRELAEQWDLPPAAPPLAIEANAPAWLALWIDGHRVSGAALALLTGSLDATDATGRWSASNLPQQPLRVVAWRHQPAINNVATEVAYPWPAMVTIDPVD